MATLLAIHPKTARTICQEWTEQGFLEIADPSKRSRTYRLSAQYEKLVND